MTIRTDFVTNSSSSSFVVALKNELTQEQKNAIADAMVKEFLGNPLLTPESTQEEIEAFFDKGPGRSLDSEEQNLVHKSLKAGKSIFSEELDFEMIYYEDKSAPYEVIFKALEETGDGRFTGIDTDFGF